MSLATLPGAVSADFRALPGAALLVLRLPTGNTPGLPASALRFATIGKSLRWYGVCLSRGSGSSGGLGEGSTQAGMDGGRTGVESRGLGALLRREVLLVRRLSTRLAAFTGVSLCVLTLYDHVQSNLLSHSGGVTGLAGSSRPIASLGLSCRVGGRTLMSISLDEDWGSTPPRL